MEIISLREHPEKAEEFITYFSSHWLNSAVYRDCMTACLNTESPLPQWYLLMTDDGKTAGGFGLITNDFNARMDLWPWLCALFIGEQFRGNGFGKKLLEHGKEETRRLGFDRLYLATNHVGYYEKYNFEFIGITSDPFGGSSRIYRTETK